MLVMICDDDINIANYIKSLIEKNYDENIKVNTYNTVDELEHSIFNKEIPNAIIMDICVEKSNGIDALKKVRKYIPRTPVIFITGYTEYCQDIFIDFNPFGLLTKPIDSQKLYFYIDKIISQYKSDQPLNVEISANGQKINIDKNDIIFLESKERKVIYHTKIEEFQAYLKLDNAMNKIDNSFLRCHKSYAVNLKYISDFSKCKISLTNGNYIPVSRSYYEKVKRQIFEYKASKIGL